MSKVIEKIEKEQIRQEPLASYAVGDAVRVHVKIREGGKERIQPFAGTIIGMRQGGVNASFTVRRISHGVGVEKVFPVHSPAVVRVEIEGSSHVRRAKLYYLRELSGKQARLREKLKKS